MALASKFSANERLVRKRLAARLRQRRCRERKRELASAQKLREPAVVETSSSLGVLAENTGFQQQSVLNQEHRDASEEFMTPFSTSRYPPESYPHQAAGGSIFLPAELVEKSFDARPPQSSSFHAVVAAPSPHEYGPVPVSPGSSTMAESESIVKGRVPPSKPLASQEMAAIDAMLALRSNDASCADECEEETASTSSLSTREDHCAPSDTVKVQSLVPDTLYPHYLPVAPPPPPPYCHPHFHHHHHHLSPPPPHWGPHYHQYHNHPATYYPPSQPSCYWKPYKPTSRVRI